MFGRVMPEGAIIGWSARTIFEPYYRETTRGQIEFKKSKRPLDILGDRQGYVGPEDEAAQQQFFAELNGPGKIIAWMQDIAPWFGKDSNDCFVKHFPWPHDEKKVIVAEGSPQGSYGYFYVCAYLVPRDQAKPEQEPPALVRDREARAIRAQRATEAAADMQRWEIIRREERAEIRRRRDVIAKRITNSPHKEPGDNLEPGDHVSVFVNQGERDAFVLAIDGAGAEALVEYYMPAGKRFMLLIDAKRHTYLQSVNGKRLTAAWKARLEKKVA